MNAIIEFTQNFFNNLLGNQPEQDGVHPFNGGVHPPEHKDISCHNPIGTLPIPKKLTLPLRQHIGHLPKLRVNIGDHVLKGQLLAEAEGNVSAAIHAPTSGTITDISEQVIPHPSGLKDHCITLIPDGSDTWGKKQAIDWRNIEKHLLVNHLRESGIVGLGGATFPSHIKLRANGQSNIQTLVINAAECEPYITCDDRLMQERAEEIAKGIEIVKWMLGAQTCIIGIEDNKPDAEAAMQAHAKAYEYQVKRVPTLYPSGDARRLVHLLTGKEVPYNQRSTDIGIQVFNVATVLAVHRYFDHGEPAISRVVTMTGSVKQPQNFEVLFGTPLSELVAAAGGAHHDTTHFIMGGPMMGFSLPLEDIPISKAANCIIAVTPDLFETPPPAMPCIRCARCADACPVSLQPQELYWFSKSDQFEKARDYQLFDCIECGCCSYVCPSNIPLVQYYRYAKSEIIASDKAKEAADLARERNEFRLARIEREKVERAQKHAERAQAAKAKKTDDAKKAELASKPMATDADQAMKQEAIAAAVARAKAKKAADASSGITPKNTDNVSANVAAEIEAIDKARAQAKTLHQDKQPNDAEKQAKIQAAIAKAKALKAEKQASVGEKLTTSEEDKQAKIQAAIAKAKAAKALAQQKDVTQQVKTGAATSDNAIKTPDVTAPAPAADDKQAKIQAALAKARANKKAADAAKGLSPQVEAEANSAVKTQPVKDDELIQQIDTAEADKQAKIQAALAKARANKQAADAAKSLTSAPPQDETTKTPLQPTSSMDNEADEKQAKVQAALERARANKLRADAAKAGEVTPTVPPGSQAQPSNAVANDEASDKQAKIQAALARARANKQAADAAKSVNSAMPQHEPTNTATQSSSSKDTEGDEKQAKIQAALERARANKRKADAARATQSSSDKSE